MKKVMALYGGGKSCMLYSESGGGHTVFTVSSRFDLNDAVLYVWDGKLYRVELGKSNSAVLNENVDPAAAFLVLNGRMALENSNAVGGRAFSERIRSEILNRENKRTHTEAKETDKTEETEKSENPQEYINGEFRSDAMKAILKKAEELFSPLDAQQNADIGNEQGQEHAGPNTDALFNPFPDAFPRSVWKKVAYPGTNRYYLEGRAVKDGARFIIHALPGEYSQMHPMMGRNGFKKFMRSTDGSGYWLKIRRQKTPFGH